MTLAVLLLACAAMPARAQPLIADLSSHLVAITTGFTGADVYLFGATDGPGEVIVVITGPESRVTVRRKERVAGIWVNRLEHTFAKVPVFYAAFSSKPVEDFDPESVLARHQIGLSNIRTELIDPDVPVAEANVFRTALLRNKQREGVYQAEVGRVTFLGNRLFRTRVTFPSNVPTGTYTVTTLLVRSGAVVSAQATPLVVSKVGLGADIYAFAHQRPAIYGAIAVLIAVMAGWLASVVFRKV